MPSEAALNLSFLELLQVLNEKLTLGCARVRKTRLGGESAIALKTEIESLESKVHEILGFIPSLRNMLQPINWLSPEILSHIVRYLPDEHARDTSSIIPMTHVCQYWRRSIISTPENWTRVSSERIGLAELSLERCEMAPLELWIDVRQGGVTPEFFDLMIPYLQNTKVLGIDSGLTGREFAETLQKFLPTTPNLQSLSLFGDAGDAPLDWSNDSRGQSTPPLTYLYLSTIPLYHSFLRLTTLTNFTLYHSQFNLQLDTLLDFLAENRSLEYAVLDIQFVHPSLRNSRCRVPIKNRLRSLSISSSCAMDVKALISKIAVQKGAHLTVGLFEWNAESTYIHTIVSMAHLLNLGSPTSMEYRPNECSIRTIRLLGPNGSFSLKRWSGTEALFVEFPLLPLDDIRTFHLRDHVSNFGSLRRAPTVFPPLSFPSLETLAVERETAVSHLLSAFFSNPASPRRLKTLGFFDCVLDEGFVKKLTRFSSNRKNTTSARLLRVAIVNSKGQLPTSTMINELGKHVPDVDVRVGKELPPDLKWGGPVD